VCCYTVAPAAVGADHPARLRGQHCDRETNQRLSYTYWYPLTLARQYVKIWASPALSAVQLLTICALQRWACAVWGRHSAARSTAGTDGGTTEIVMADRQSRKLVAADGGETFPGGALPMCQPGCTLMQNNSSERRKKIGRMPCLQPWLA
jgi:hypothetical protein